MEKGVIMKVSLGGNYEFEFFQIEELAIAKTYAERTDGPIYSWKTAEISNWLEKRLSIVDVLGLAVLPKGLPDLIDLPDDEEE